MKKTLAAIALATGLVIAGTSVSVAATSAPSIAKPTSQLRRQKQEKALQLTK